MLQIHMIPALKDNYFWLIQPDVQSPDSYIIDPGAAEPVYDYLQLYKLQLKAILLTHHHHDHIDGAAELSEKYQISIYGPKSNRIPQVTHYLNEGDELLLKPLSARILTIPGHTLDHIAYFLQPPNSPPLLFSGDTIFGAGCGRLFDGTAPLLYAALQRIAKLPKDTLIYGGHEYTLANIRFALTIEPENADLIARQTIEFEKRSRGLATLPTRLDVELRTNPFLRCHLNSVRTSVEQHVGQIFATDSDVFASLRLIKDSF
jgi:hydroxyacylglutathione hydrolase